MTRRTSPDASIESLVALLNAGEWGQCVDYTAQLISKNGHRADLAFILSLAYFNDGKFKEALPWARESIVLGFDYSACLLQGDIESALFQYQSAHQSYVKALEQHPGDVTIHNKIGQNLINDMRFDQATVWLAQSLDIEPSNDTTRVLLASAMDQSGYSESALSIIRGGLLLKPDSPQLLREVANLLINEGAFTEAQTQLTKVIKANPRDALAWVALVNSCKITHQESDWLNTMAELVNDLNIPDVDRINLNYAMGKCYDDLDQNADAFAHYSAANLLKRRAIGSSDRKEISRIADLFIRSHTSEVMQKDWSGFSDSKKPLFVIGTPRSGTTLLEHLLTSNSTITGAGELNFLGQELNRYRMEVFYANYTADILQTISGGYLKSLNEIFPYALHVIDKMPANFRFSGPIHVAFPNARLLHIHRNPIDTCLSIYFHNFPATHRYSTDLSDLAYYYREYVRLMLHWRSVIPANRLLDVPYEALVQDHTFWMRKIMNFLEIDWNESGATNAANRTVRTFSRWQVRQPIYTTSRERWRKYEKFIGPLLELDEHPFG